MSIGITASQLRLLRYIRGYQLARGYSPSFDEMTAGIGSSTRSTTHGLLARLEERGKIRRLRNKARAIEVLDAPPVTRAPDGAPLYFIAVAG